MSNPNQPPVPSNEEGSSVQLSGIVGQDVGPNISAVFTVDEATAISKLMLLADEGPTQNQRYGKRFQLVHLSLFFLISHDARHMQQIALENYLDNHNTLIKAYNFNKDPAYKNLFARGFNPLTFVERERTRLVNNCRDATNITVKKAAFVAYIFSTQLKSYLSHPIFKPFAVEFLALTCRLDIQDHADRTNGIPLTFPRVHLLYWELFSWMFEYFVLRIDHYLSERVPGKQYANEKKFFLARKDYYMALDYNSTKTSLVAYCYHILTMYIDQSPRKEPNLMLVVFTDLRKLKIKLQGNARELNQAAAKTLEDAEYDILSKVFRLNRWKIHLIHN